MSIFCFYISMQLNHIFHIQSFKQSKNQIDYSICQIIPHISSHSRVSRRHQLLSPNLLPLFNSSSPATAQKPLNFISHICGLGASVGCERVERTFNAPRLKAQIWLMKFNGFVCSSLNELNSNPSDFVENLFLFVKKYN